MPLSADVLVKEASGLTYAERSKLVDTLLTTLDPVTEDDCDTAWFAEIGRREQALSRSKKDYELIEAAIVEMKNIGAIVATAAHAFVAKERALVTRQ